MDMLHPSSTLPSERMAGLMFLLHIQAWASALPSDSKGQCEKPQNVGWQRYRQLTLFCIGSNQEMSIERIYLLISSQTKIGHFASVLYEELYKNPMFICISYFVAFA